LQDRLIKEMRLRNINNIEEAQDYLPEFIAQYNRSFAVPPVDPADAHRSPTPKKLAQLDQILSIQETRKLSKNLEFSYKHTIYQIKRHGSGYSFRYATVHICEKTDGTIAVFKDQKALDYTTIKHQRQPVILVDTKGINAAVDSVIEKLKEAA
jgi:hypothetical protein